MMGFSGQLLNSSGLVRVGCPKILPLHIRRQNAFDFSSYVAARFGFEKITGGRLRYNQDKCAGTSRIGSVATGHHQLSVDDELPEEPFWLSLIKEAIWGLRSLFAFLVEQPGELKYIEWPSFKSTLKTATLSLVLVAVFIIALSSVDAALYYLLALVLRRTS